MQQLLVCLFNLKCISIFSTGVISSRVLCEVLHDEAVTRWHSSLLRLRETQDYKQGRLNVTFNHQNGISNQWKILKRTDNKAAWVSEPCLFVFIVVKTYKHKIHHLNYFLKYMVPWYSVPSHGWATITNIHPQNSFILQNWKSIPIQQLTFPPSSPAPNNCLYFLLSDFDCSRYLI